MSNWRNYVNSGPFEVFGFTKQWDRNGNPYWYNRWANEKMNHEPTPCVTCRRRMACNCMTTLAKSMSPNYACSRCRGGALWSTNCNECGGKGFT